MKNLLSFSLVLGMFVFASCGDASENASKDASSAESSESSSDVTTAEADGEKSFCDCMEIAKNNPDLDVAPAGCEWMETKSEMDMAGLMIQALNDCPSLLEEMGLTEEVQSMKDDLESIDDMESEMEYYDELEEEIMQQEMEEEMEEGM
tara:strand:+ start:7245 stop:7691 length:447 start_codon:yes stop_codon:yes gene_type:complete